MVAVLARRFDNLDIAEEAAAEAFANAVELAGNIAETAYLTRRRDHLE